MTPPTDLSSRPYCTLCKAASSGPQLPTEVTAHRRRSDTMTARGASVDSYGSPRKGAGLRSAMVTSNHAREVDDDAATETGSITGSTVQGSVVESRIGAGIEGSALANLSTAPGVALTGFNGACQGPSYSYHPPSRQAGGKHDN